MYVRTCFDKNADNFRVARFGRPVQRRLLVVIFCMNVRTRFNQDTDSVRVAFQAASCSGVWPCSSFA